MYTVFSGLLMAINNILAQPQNKLAIIFLQEFYYSGKSQRNVRRSGNIQENWGTNIKTQESCDW